MNQLIFCFLILTILSSVCLAAGTNNKYKVDSLRNCLNQSSTQDYDYSDNCTNINFENNRVFGMSQRDVLSLDGDPNDTACSKRHLQNGFSNRWCHAYMVKIGKNLIGENLHPIFSNILSASMFLPKEYMVDKKPSLADLVISEYPIAKINKNLGAINVSVFGDGLFILGIYNHF